MKYVIDIDGTICKEVGEVIGREPYMDRIAKINKLYDEGHTIVFYTARGLKSGRGEPHYRPITEQQLKEWGVKYHELCFKGHNGDYFIDDRGINAEDFFVNIKRTSLQTYENPICIGESGDGVHRVFKISDKYSAKLIRQNREHPRCKNYGDVFYEIKIAMLLYKNNISIPEPITCDYIEVDGKLEIAFIMEYIDGTSFDLTDDKETIELGEKLAEEESKKINKLGIFKNVSGPQWILTNDKQIKLIDFEKWELKNETS